MLGAYRFINHCDTLRISDILNGREYKEYPNPGVGIDVIVELIVRLDVGAV